MINLEKPSLTRRVGGMPDGILRVNLSVFVFLTAMQLLLLPAGLVVADDGSEGAIAGALGEVNARCPSTYPDTVIPLPEESQFDQMSVPRMVELLGSESPAMRSAAAGAVARRGDEVVPVLVKALQSENKSLVAGSALALSRLIQQQARDLRGTNPGMTVAQAQAKIREKFTAQGGLFIALTRSPSREVRNAALGALLSIRPDTPQAKEAILALCADPDEYIAASAVGGYNKLYKDAAMPRDKVLPALRSAMRQPLPGGRGSAVAIIKSLDEKSQREFIPLLLEHLDWQPNRDTMFGASGQAEALQLLTQLKVKDVIPRIPSLMTKTMRGEGLFQPCIESLRAFGPEAKAIVPQLNAYADELEKSLGSAPARNKVDIQTKINSLREAVKHVEGK